MAGIGQDKNLYYFQILQVMLFRRIFTFSWLILLIVQALLIALHFLRWFSFDLVPWSQLLSPSYLFIAIGVGALVEAATQKEKQQPAIPSNRAQRRAAAREALKKKKKYDRKF